MVANKIRQYQADGQSGKQTKNNNLNPLVSMDTGIQRGKDRHRVPFDRHIFNKCFHHELSHNKKADINSVDNDNVHKMFRKNATQAKLIFSRRNDQISILQEHLKFSSKDNKSGRSMHEC